MACPAFSSCESNLRVVKWGWLLHLLESLVSKSLATFVLETLLSDNNKKKKKSYVLVCWLIFHWSLSTACRDRTSTFPSHILMRQTPIFPHCAPLTVPVKCLMTFLCCSFFCLKYCGVFLEPFPFVFRGGIYCSKGSLCGGGKMSIWASGEECRWSWAPANSLLQYFI